MSDLVITIGRENGSGGREVGRILSERLGIMCYDREIVEETAARTGMSVEKVESIEERGKNSMFFFGGIPSANPIFRQQSETIMELASKGPCIFVGRCADFVLRERDDVVKVFVHAPVPDRIKRSAERNGISEKDAYDRIRSRDEERAGYYRRYTGNVWGDARNYDLTVNTGSIGVANAAGLIIEYIRMSSRKLPGTE